ncbi:Pimeloyl-ACP methyl ester carboxylesterase [Pedobacter steynii]|uniref:Pimeloyl-ACP methyl ester carboxylesterase n=1 Tax=Pedobacter steynii TaxID=430522 RepID=A0A1G9KA30_9SPHI|nr:alpha/beta hydrolase [Pedobacter steynii]NQX38483.1 alpha/beta hydrolase [Pedobacter steynii]SDL46143.1 Pimeloyl-ACP methyl ester carboxylesterase [Pedobacter steynii]
MIQSKTIILIHGLFVNNTSWAAWKAFFEQKGYTVYTPANPGHEGNPQALRNQTHPQLTQTSFEDVVNNIIKLIDTLPEKPIVVGHSLAGLVVQKLIELDKAVAGVSIDGAPPKNVLAPWSTIKVVYPVVDFFKGNSPFMGSKAWYRKAFFNNMSLTESEQAFEDIAVPESRKIARDTLLKPFAKVDFKKAHQPLLFIAGEQDAIFNPKLTKKIAGAYKDPNSVVDYKEFQGRSHFIAGQKGWEEVAQYIDQWISEKLVA